MNITTDAPELYAHKLKHVEFYVGDITVTEDLAKPAGVAAKIERDGSPAVIGYPDGATLYQVVLAIQAETRHAFQWLDSLERRMGGHIADCKGELPYGRWVIIDLTKRCLHLLESPRGVDLELPVFVGVAK